MPVVHAFNGELVGFKNMPVVTKDCDGKEITVIFEEGDIMTVTDCATVKQSVKRRSIYKIENGVFELQ